MLRILSVLTGRLFSRGAQVITLIILARGLKPEEFGIYGVITSIIFLVGQVGHLGLRQSVALMIGQNRMTDGEAAYSFMLVWPALVCLSVGVLFAFGIISTDMIGASSAVAVVISVAGMLALTLGQGILLGRGQVGQFAATESGPRAILTLLSLLAWSFGLLDLEVALWSFAVAFAIYVPYLARVVLRGAADRRLALGKLPPMIGHGIFYALSIGVILLQGRVGLFFVSSQSASDAGQFFAAQRASEVFLELASAAALVLFSDSARAKGNAEVMKRAMRTAAVLLVVFTVAGLVAMNFTQLLTLILLGPKYTPAAEVLSILLLGLGPAAAVRILNSTISGSGRPYISAAVVFSALLLNIAICYVLVPTQGVKGAAIALVAAQTVAAIIYAAISLIYWRKGSPA
jgi:O-antigen/teichoic acid export membrane protein